MLFIVWIWPISHDPKACILFILATLEKRRDTKKGWRREISVAGRSTPNMQNSYVNLAEIEKGTRLLEEIKRHLQAFSNTSMFWFHADICSHPLPELSNHGVRAQLSLLMDQIKWTYCLLSDRMEKSIRCLSWEEDYWKKWNVPIFKPDSAVCKPVKFWWREGFTSCLVSLSPQSFR